MALPLPDANGDGQDGRPLSGDGSLASGASTPPLYPPPPPPLPKPPIDGPPQPTQMRQQQLLFGLQPPPSVAAAAAAAGLLGFPPAGPGSIPGMGPSSGIFAELSRAAADRMVSDDAWRNFMLHFDSGEGCGFQGCETEETEHYHCKDEGCEAVFGRSDSGAAREHGRNHFIQERITERHFLRVEPDDEDGMDEPSLSLPDIDKKRDICGEQCPHKRTKLHYHCLWVSKDTRGAPLSLSAFPFTA
jgi:hypothetical protein